MSTNIFILVNKINLIINFLNFDINFLNFFKMAIRSHSICVYLPARDLRPSPILACYGYAPTADLRPLSFSLIAALSLLISSLVVFVFFIFVVVLLLIGWCVCRCV